MSGGDDKEDNISLLLGAEGPLVVRRKSEGGGGGGRKDKKRLRGGGPGPGGGNKQREGKKRSRMEEGEGEGEEDMIPSTLPVLEIAKAISNMNNTNGFIDDTPKGRVYHGLTRSRIFEGQEQVPEPSGQQRNREGGDVRAKVRWITSYQDDEKGSGLE